MKVVFVSRCDMIKLIKNKSLRSVCIVSVSDNNREKQEMYNLCKEYSQGLCKAFVNFPDVEDGVCLTDKKIKQILRVCDYAFKNKLDIVVHCFLGVSRSGAIAKYINDYYMLGDTYLEDYTGHNKNLYYALMEASGVMTQRQYYKSMETT